MSSISTDTPCEGFEHRGPMRVLWLAYFDLVFKSFSHIGDVRNETNCDTEI
jgi:hypothetical protein